MQYVFWFVAAVIVLCFVCMVLVDAGFFESDPEPEPPVLEFPKHIHEACVERHANGAYGFFIMRKYFPERAKAFAADVEAELRKA